MNGAAASTSPSSSPSSEANPARYRLAIASDNVDQNAALPILQRTLGLNAIDARTRLNHVPAVWIEEFDQGVAQSAAAQLQELGIEAAAVPADKIPDLRQVRTLHRVACIASGLVIDSLTNETDQTIPWSRVGLLSIADIVDVHGRTEGRLPDMFYRHDPGITDQKALPGDHGLELWILCDPPFEAFRIVADMMNYEYLQERRTSSSSDNFQSFVCDILEHGSNVLLTGSARDFLNRPTHALRRKHTALSHREAVLACWCVKHGASPSDG